MTDEPQTFGALLSRYRTAALLTQEQLAESAGLSARGVSDLERGIKGRPRTYTVRQLSDALQLSSDDRATFEQAASAVGVDSRPNGAVPEGNFLGARPISSLVAREEEVERLGTILDTVADGAGQLILLGGEMGAGKTRLLQHLMVEAHRRDMDVLTGRCRSTERDTPFHPVLAALGELDTRLPPSARDAHRDWQKVQYLVSEYAADRAAGSGVAQQRILSVVSDLLLLLARSRPVAVLIDDLHWADADTLNLFHHLAHTTRASPILLAGSFRDVRLGEESPELAALLRDVSRERLVERMTVRRLSLEETTELTSTTMGRQEVSDEFASFVYRRTKGNPRLIDQLVRSLGGRLELQGEIGAGSTGRVFRAFDRTLQQVVAAKLVLARTAIELDGLMRFQQEGAVLARLDHPNIVQIHDTFAEEHATCIIMELLDGQSLGRILQDGPLPPARARNLGMQVSDALAYAHGQSIVHRDIKPDNVMVLPGDRVKVTDFGIARIIQPDRSLHSMGTTGMRMGTPLYMAPEQIEGKHVDGRTDIYAFGAMLYHMITGRPPFDDSDVLAIVVKQLQEEPVPPSDRDASIPADWDGVILRALAKDPGRRYASVTEMREAISSLSQEAPPQSRAAAHSEEPATIRDPAITPAATRGRRAQAGWFVIAPVLGALVLAGGLVLPRHWPGRQEGGPTARLVASWAIPPDPVFTPAGVAVDRHGVVFASDSVRDRIVEFSSAGHVKASWGTRGSGRGQLRNPGGLALDHQGHVYVADTGNNRIEEFSSAGRFIRAFGRRGTHRGQFRSPQAVAIGTAGTIFVADTGNGRIEALTPSGTPVPSWDPAGNQRGQLGRPTGVAAYGDLESDALVTDPAAGEGHILDPGGTNGFPWPAGLVSPSAVVIDARGNVYLLDTGLQEIRKFDTRGILLHSWHGPFRSAQGLAVDRHGAMYVADAGNHRILKLGPAGRMLSPFTVSPKASGAHASPQALARDTAGNLYVTDARGGQVVVFSPSGSVRDQWIVRGSSGSPALLYGVAVDALGHVYVTDEANDRIVRLSPSGTRVGTWGELGDLNGQFKGPAGIHVAHSFVYVANTFDNRIEKIKPSGEFIGEWYVGDSSPGMAAGLPYDLSIDSRGNMFVTDAESDTVVKLDPNGVTLKTLGGTGSQPGQLWNPQGIAVSASGTIYVADTGNHRVEIFAPSGKYIGTIRKGLIAPADVLLAERHGAPSTLYVADSGSGRVLQFSVAA